MEYTYNHLTTILSSIDRALNEDLDKSERLMYLKNLKLGKVKLRELSELLLDKDDKFVEYQNKAFQVQVDNGAKTQRLQNGSQMIIDTSEMDEKKVEKELKKLEKEYKDAIQAQKEINQENEKTKAERTIEVDWFTINYEDISDVKNYNVLNENTLDFINA